MRLEGQEFVDNVPLKKVMGYLQALDVAPDLKTLVLSSLGLPYFRPYDLLPEARHQIEARIYQVLPYHIAPTHHDASLPHRTYHQAFPCLIVLEKIS